MSQVTGARSLPVINLQTLPAVRLPDDMQTFTK
jgi:hypothetical protein